MFKDPIKPRSYSPGDSGRDGSWLGFGAFQRPRSRDRYFAISPGCEDREIPHPLVRITDDRFEQILETSSHSLDR